MRKIQMTDKPGRAVLLKRVTKGLHSPTISDALPAEVDDFVPATGERKPDGNLLLSPRPLSVGGRELRCPSGYRSPTGIF
jgi:hypothetical protein